MFGVIRVWRSVDRTERQALFTLMAVVVAAYIVWAAAIYYDFQRGEAFGYAGWEVVLLLVLGVVYLYILYMHAALQPGFTNTALIVPLLIVLAAAIQWLAEPGFMWLVALPLVGTIADTYPDWRQWVINAIVFATMIAPYAPYGPSAIISVLFTLGPALLFVVAFSQLRLQESLARQRSEALARELEAANRQLAEYAAQAEELATTRERNRLAREIHDNLGHYLTIVNVQLEAAKILLTQDSGRALEAIGKAQRLTQEGLQAVRHSVGALRGDALAGAPLEEAIGKLVNELESAGVNTRYQIDGEVRPLDHRQTLTLFRVAQEGLTNVRKHARAAHVDVQLDYSAPDVVRLTIQDNGVGAPAQNKPDGFGLLGIHERVALLAGKMEVETAPGAGFRLHVALPG